MPQRVAVFGGAFDPFHNGHVAVIKLLLSEGLADTVLVVPSGDRPDKRGVSPASLRHEMTVLGVQDAFGGDTRVVVSDLHSAQRVDYGTIDLVRYLKHQPGIELTIVIGGELVQDLPQWKDADELRDSARFLAILRPGASVPDLPRGWNITMAPPFPDGGVLISSTELRSRLSAGQSCAGLMPITVEAYCLSHRMYYDWNKT